MKGRNKLGSVIETYHFDPVIPDKLSKDGVKRAAAYCRVSTLMEEQELSFDAQVKYYTEMIDRDPSLTLVGIYGDQGFSGLDMTKRKEFQRLIADCEDGLIDVVYVKSVSRFSRNAVDVISVLRRLKAFGVQVFFEKEGLDSTDPSTEMILNLYATMAQNESCSQSQNLSWAYTHRAKLGNPYRNACFGYRIEKRKGDPFRYWVINEREARIVRRVFRLAYQGYCLGEIAAITSMSSARVSFILRNEVYRGDILTHKQIKLDYTLRKATRNTGQREQIYIEGHHEPIVDPSVFDEVQSFIRNGLLHGRRKTVRKKWLTDHPEILMRRITAETEIKPGADNPLREKEEETC